MDSLFLHNIVVRTRIGVPDEERATEQELKISIELFHPAKVIAASDDVTKGIDYKTLTEDIVELAKTERKTIERFAEDSAAHVLKKFTPEGGVKVTVKKKPQLPFESVSITIVRP